MAPLPPPPPPAPPPPPMGGPPVASPPKLSKGETTDRNALLSQIRGGAKLKKAKVVNDRSAPVVDGKSSNTSSGPGLPSKGSSGGFGSSGAGGPPMLGGLFAGGVPKLKPTGSKLVSNGLTVSANKVNNNYTKTDQSVRPTPPSTTSSIKTSLEEKFQNNSSFLHSKTASPNSGYGLSVANNSNKFHTMKAREKPSYVLSEGKGQAPQVPNQTNHRAVAPELPRKPPAVQRSNSQSSGRNGAMAGRRPGPPNMKPPPPPKTTSASPLQTSVNRRQSFTDDNKVNASDNWNGRPDISALVSNFNQHGIRPPAPPKNTSPMVNGMSQSPAYPPPPPPVSTIPTRSNSSVARMPSTKSSAPNIPTQAPKMPPPIRPPMGPPPPPPHRTTSNATNNNYPLPPPPSQTKVIPTAFRNGGSAPAPPPPVRNASMGREQNSNSSDFSSRFAQFKAIFELPAPTPMTHSNKVYPSHMQQSQRRRDPPPPPPQSNGMSGHSPNAQHNLKKSNPVLHIQIGSTAAQS